MDNKEYPDRRRISDHTIMVTIWGGILAIVVQMMVIIGAANTLESRLTTLEVYQRIIIQHLGLNETRQKGGNVMNFPKQPDPEMTTEFEQVLMDRDGLSAYDASTELAQARRRVGNGENPEDILREEYGLEPDYIMDIIPAPI